MDSSRHQHLDASLFDDGVLEQLLAILGNPGEVALVGPDGTAYGIPEPIYCLLLNILQRMLEGKVIFLAQEDEKFTTQAAANFLGMSRTHLVKLLEGGEIPFDKVGTHRRIAFRDLLTYAKDRDTKRRSGLNKLFTKVEKAEKYDGDFTGSTR